MLTALDMGVPDRLPCTTHEIIPFFLDSCVDGISESEFFDKFQLDKTIWLNPLRALNGVGAGVGVGEKVSPIENLYQPFIETGEWKLQSESVSQSGRTGVRYTISTPIKDLTMILESNEYTSWISEPLIKEPKDIDLIAQYAPSQTCDAEKVRSAASTAGDSAIIRGMIPGFEINGQPGCWQDAACLFGIEKLIYKTFDDPAWVKTLLSILQKRKLTYVDSLRDSGYDLVELGGGDASTTVISPAIFREFAAPYDTPIVEKVREQGIRVTYHTCGGMMPILEDIAEMGVSAMETFTPPGMGGDVDLAEAKKRIGDRVCLIGGFDQGYFFTKATEAEVEKEVIRCFKAAGENGGFILTPSDHFFTADPKLLTAYSRAAKNCTY